MRILNNEATPFAIDDCEFLELFKISARRTWCLSNKFRKTDYSVSEIVYLADGT